MSLEIKCQLERKEVVVNGIGKTQKPYTLIKFTVVQHGYDNPTELDLTAFGEKANFINDTSIGTELLVSGYPVSATKEYEKDGVKKTWRGTEFRMTNIEVFRDNGNPIVDMPPEPSISEADGDDLPF